jgi:hypothetical protein
MEEAADGRFRWTTAHAVDVFPSQGGWLELTWGGGPQDMQLEPLEVDVWRSHEHVLHVAERDPRPITRYLRAPSPPAMMMIEIHLDRTWRPGDSSDPRALGVAVNEWKFVNTLPPDAAKVD